MAKHCLILKNRERHTKEDDMKRRRASSVDATTYDDCVAHPFKFPPKDLFENKDKKAPDNPPKSDVNAINPQNNTLWALIFAVFPDICPDYVERKHRELRERLHKIPDNEMLVDALLEAGTYPTLQERKRKKVKAEASPGKKDKWRVDDGFKRDRAYLDAA